MANSIPRHISWKEVHERAIAFSQSWRDDRSSEASGKQTFWNEFFEIFGRDRKSVASFEVAVKSLKGNYKHIDLLWQGTLLVEHKSRGQSLEVAESQAIAYVQDLVREKADDVPRYVIISDFNRIALYDLAPTESGKRISHKGHSYSVVQFKLEALHDHVRRFAFIKGDVATQIDPEDPANQKAYGLMCSLHDELAKGGFGGLDLERFLVRILFCLFAEDTGVFEPNSFRMFLKTCTREDGSDLGARLNELFEVLNTPYAKRDRELDEDLARFPYVNGDLFAQRLAFRSFNRSMRKALLDTSDFIWAKVSPAVFGSLFQGVMLQKDRRQQGAHYTSEANIMKILKGLFLDNLEQELQSLKVDHARNRRSKLEVFHEKLRNIRLLDPASGCGNFLVLAYRELRRIEHALLQELYKDDKQRFLNIRDLILLDVDQFYGIEQNEWPVRISEVALWLMDQQMNRVASELFGQTFERLPLSRSPHIVRANALQVDWGTVLPPSRCAYVLGNPPFVGKSYQTPEQKKDMQIVFKGMTNIGDLDYVTCWFKKAAEYILGTQIKVGFVSTNSITQGEQVPIVWNMLLGQLKIKIHFAHRTFAWVSEARGKAHVHVVIIGFANYDCPRKVLTEYQSNSDEGTSRIVSHIGPYLTAGSEVYVSKRTSTPYGIPEMRCGNKPTDDGNLLFTDDEKKAFLKVEPAANRFIRPFIGSEELINGQRRWCLWLEGIAPEQLRSLPHTLERINKVRKFREASSAKPTRDSARTPAKFFYISQPSTQYIAIPEVSSERRQYIPIGFLPPSVIASNKIYVVPSSELWIFGILSSAMHMAWVRVVAGRLESRYQYSGSMVYNTFPWPKNVTPKQRDTVKECAQDVLAKRLRFLPPNGSASLADIYDPLSMPASLLEAHANLDHAVDRCFRTPQFASESERVEYLFLKYQEMCEGEGSQTERFKHAA